MPVTLSRYIRHATLLLALCLLGLLVGCGGGGGGGGGGTTATGSLEGYVFASDSSGLATKQVPSGTVAISGAVVTVLNTALTATSDANGYFRLDGVPVGQQTLVVAKTGFSTTQTTVTVSADQVTRVNGSGGGILLTIGARAKWTFMVYMNGDNDLEEFAIQDLNEMEQVGSSSDVNIVVEVDRIRGWDSSNGDWSDARRYYVTKDTDTEIINSQILAQLGEVDMGDPQRLKTFVQWAMTEYPADYYLLDMWNHGAGFRSRAASSTHRAFSFDDTQGTSIKTTELPDVVRSIDTLDILAWDSSLMQMMEIADQIGDAATFVVGSEESPPGDGYPYQTFLSKLVANPSLTPEQFATLIVNDTIDTLGSTNDVTQSALRQAKLPALRTALSGLGTALLNALPQHAAGIAQARQDAQRYGHGAFTFRDYKDLQDFCEKLDANVSDAAVQAATAAVVAALQDALVAEAHAGFSVRNSHGLSIYVPAPSDYLSIYNTLHFALNTTWDEFLKAQTQ